MNRDFHDLETCLSADRDYEENKDESTLVSTRVRVRRKGR